jgi:hypothetical protein
VAVESPDDAAVGALFPSGRHPEIGRFPAQSHALTIHEVAGTLPGVIGYYHFVTRYATQRPVELTVRGFDPASLSPCLPALRGRRRVMCRSKAEGGRRCHRSKARRVSAAAGSTGGSVLSGRLGQIAQDQIGDFLDAAVAAAPVDSAVALRAAAAADLANQVAQAITATLEANGYPRGTWQSHLVCSALAAVARAMEAGENLAKTAVIKGVTAALAACRAPAEAAALAGRAAADALMKVTPVRHWEDIRHAVQLLAAAMCPKVADHPEVERYCLQPTASDLLSSAIQEELAKLPVAAERSPSAG